MDLKKNKDISILYLYKKGRKERRTRVNKKQRKNIIIDDEEEILEI